MKEQKKNKQRIYNRCRIPSGNIALRIFLFFFHYLSIEGSLAKRREFWHVIFKCGWKGKWWSTPRLGCLVTRFSWLSDAQVFNSWKFVKPCWITLGREINSNKIKSLKRVSKPLSQQKFIFKCRKKIPKLKRGSSVQPREIAKN